jgi:hypothetical protein
MNRTTWLDLHNETPYTEHDAILGAALREHKFDECQRCGAAWPDIVGTLRGYQVVCSECGYTMEEVEL